MNVTGHPGRNVHILLILFPARLRENIVLGYNYATQLGTGGCTQKVDPTKLYEGRNPILNIAPLCQ